MRKTISSMMAAVMLVTMLSYVPKAWAAVSVTSSMSSNVSSDSVSGSSVALPALTVSESAAGDISATTLTWSVPSGFVLDQTSVANVTYAGNGLTGAASVSFPDSTHFSLNITATSTLASSFTVGSVTPIKVKAQNGTPLATGNITLTSGSLNGVNSSTSFGTLTQVAGAAAKLAFSAQPTSVNVGSTFSATVAVKDQFNNTVITDNGRAVVISANLVASTTAGTLGGTLSKNTASGLAVFNDLSFNAINQITLSASSSPLTSALSNLITVSASVTPTPTPTPTPTVTPTPTPTPIVNCNLKNGILVKAQNSSTIYMVVNCVLRPFTTPAIFHAKGKKFKDIVILPDGTVAQLAKGKNVGEGHDDDDDDTVIILPQGQGSTGTTTLPTISGLPEGSVVKLPNNPTIYLVSGGKLQPFTSAVTFKVRGKKFSEVRVISDTQFASLAKGEPVSLPEGTLVKGDGSTVYVIMGGKKKGITSLKVLNNHGWSLNNIVSISGSDLSAIPSGGNQDN